MTYVAKRVLFGKDGWSLDPDTFPIVAQCDDYLTLNAAIDPAQRINYIIVPYEPERINPGADQND